MIVLSFDTGGEYLNALPLFGDQGLELIALLGDRCIHCLDVLVKLAQAGSCRRYVGGPKLAIGVDDNEIAIRYCDTADSSNKRGAVRSGSPYPDNSGIRQLSGMTDIDIIVLILTC